jgi:hypothetical protein
MQKYSWPYPWNLGVDRAGLISGIQKKVRAGLVLGIQMKEGLDLYLEPW